MTKIVQPAPPSVEYLITCPTCKAVISFTPNEVNRAWAPRGDYSDPYYWLTCPGCRMSMYIPDDYGATLKKVSA
jgi:hypothetical protein